ncbi:Ff.00g028840.m01.CDS01 [Fusarium sp. VM40]|nr:Ff.00g028840.m01.CDS01 [Fusarium sp. VM40]
MSSQNPGNMPPQGPPYLPKTAGLGGRPTTSVDDPISAVLLAFFVAGAALNMTILQLNRRRSHKFILSGLLFGFCMARITANVLRIVWASYPTNTSVAIAAQVFTNAGVVLLFVVNLIFAQRILRAYHPHIGWSKPASLAFKFLYFAVAASLIMLITAVVYNFYTLNPHTKQQLRDVQLTGSTFLAILAFLPLPVVGLCLVLPRKAPMDKFGQGRMRTKVQLLTFTTVLLTLGAAFRTGVAYKIRPANDPAWYHSKACYYCFNYVIEIIVVFSYALSRFDRRFHIPDGSHAPGDYSAPKSEAQQGMYRVNTETEVFGEDERPQTAEQQKEQQRQWEAGLKDEIKKETV